MPRKTFPDRILFLIGLACALLCAGCAHVNFDHGSSRLEDKALVFGRIILDRDGEKLVISPFSMPVVIRNVETGAEPGMLAQSFEKEGSFYWAMPPGRYQLSIVLHPYSGGIQSYSFNLEKAGTSYYFGDLILHGRRRFDSMGSANMRDIRPEIEDQLEVAKRELLRRNPQLDPTAIARLVLHDMNQPSERGVVYDEAMAAQKPCCSSLATLPYKSLRLGESVSERVDLETPVFAFPEGASRFLAWKLPASSGQPFAITLRSLVTPSGMPGTGRFYIFSPAVMLLDENFNPLARQEHDLFFPVPSAMMPPRSASLMARIESSRMPPGARYLVMYSTRSIIEGTWRTSGPGFMPIAGGVLPTGVPVAVGMEPSISGRIEIEIQAQ